MAATSNPIVIKRAVESDIPAICDFIEQEWKPGHILARDRAFFRYEHFYAGKVNFVMAQTDEGKVAGILGFIPAALGLPQSDVNTVIWKVARDCKVPMLGVQLLQFVKQLPDVSMVMSVGINAKTAGIYQYLGMFTGSLRHFVLLNQALSEFRIARVPAFVAPATVETSPLFRITELADASMLNRFDFNAYSHLKPFKDAAYYRKRFFGHPVYRYQVYQLAAGAGCTGLMATRIQEHQGHRVMRIVDFTGDPEVLRYCGQTLQQLLAASQCEYADYYGYGEGVDFLTDAGFLEVSAHEGLIVPNYFSPFVQKNIPIHFFADTDKPQSLWLCKGDGDQDRPN